MTNKIAILVAIVLGITAALAANSWMEEEKKRQESRFKTVSVVVAKKTLRKNDVIRLGAGLLQGRAIPQDMVLTGSISTDQLGRYRGYIVKERIDAGQPLTVDKLEPPYDKAETSLSVVDKGLRAVTVAVDMISGVAGLIRPGDRVDLVGTFDLSRRSGSAKKSEDGVVTLYLLQNVRVIALDRNTEKVATAVTKSRKSRSKNYRTVTLEVKPQAAFEE
ncbi:MAG: Flp pilus assembly protein CpaB [Planctomycetota bacterium]|jgi:pilus assembly protein CpaB